MIMKREKKTMKGKVKENGKKLRKCDNDKDNEINIEER